MKRYCKSLVTLCKCALKDFHAIGIDITKKCIILEIFFYVGIFVDSLVISIFYLPNESFD